MNLIVNKIKVNPLISTYTHNNATSLCLITENGELYMKVSINLPDMKLENTDYIFVKNYSENKGVMEQLINQKVLSEPKFSFHYGQFDVLIHCCKILINN